MLLDIFILNYYYLLFFNFNNVLIFAQFLHLK